RGARGLRRLRRDHQPRPLVPRPHRNSHPVLRRREPCRVVRGKLPGIRAGQDAAAGYGFNDPASHQVQEVLALTCRSRHGRPCAGHPRLSSCDSEKKTWMPATSAGMTRMRIALSIILTGFLLGAPARAADPEFQQFLQALWPEAQAKGVSREVFDAAIKDLEPDLTLPDLIIPGRVEAQPPQAEFVQPPSAYLKEATFDRLTAKGRALAVQHKATLDRIEKEFGVPGPIVLAIWGRETDYGSYKVGRDVVRVLATQAYLGNRKDMFRDELIIAFKMLQDGVPRAQMRSSWGGAMGFVQLMPSEYYLYGTDFDGDGRIDIFNSVPDSLAAAAKQLVVKGWHAGTPWAYEVRAPANADCSVGSPDHALPMAEWLKRGFVPVYGRKLSTAELAEDVSLLQPEGSYGPAFLI